MKEVKKGCVLAVFGATGDLVVFLQRLKGFENLREQYRREHGLSPYSASPKP